LSIELTQILQFFFNRARPILRIAGAPVPNREGAWPLEKRAALEISVSPLDSIRPFRQTAFLSCSLAGQGAENEIWSVQD